jgi:hypothetical protein
VEGGRAKLQLVFATEFWGAEHDQVPHDIGSKLWGRPAGVPGGPVPLPCPVLCESGGGGSSPAGLPTCWGGSRIPRCPQALVAGFCLGEPFCGPLSLPTPPPPGRPPRLCLSPYRKAAAVEQGYKPQDTEGYRSDEKGVFTCGNWLLPLRCAGKPFCSASGHMECLAEDAVQKRWYWREGLLRGPALVGCVIVL